MGSIAKGAHVSAAAAWPHSSGKAARNSDHIQKLEWLVFGQDAGTCPKTDSFGQVAAGRHAEAIPAEMEPATTVADVLGERDGDRIGGLSADAAAGRGGPGRRP